MADKKKKISPFVHALTIAAVLASFFAVDRYLTYSDFITTSDCFSKNDFEITCHDHPEKVWDKVFFGNSVVISSYIEEESTSGYINLGLDFGVVSDLKEMIDKSFITLGSELVIGLNYLTLYDEFDTNPTYIWHKKFYEPYAYFERDRFYPIIIKGFDNILIGQSPAPMQYSEQSKTVYHGMVADFAMDSKLDEYEEEFFNLPLSKFSQNVSDLKWVVNYCKENNINVRVLWMPWNPKFEKPQLLTDLKEYTNSTLALLNVEVMDFEDSLEYTNFYDSGHLNYEVGARKFTKILDKWL